MVIFKAASEAQARALSRLGIALAPKDPEASGSSGVIPRYLILRAEYRALPSFTTFAFTSQL